MEVIDQKLSKLSILAKKWTNFGLKAIGGVQVQKYKLILYESVFQYEDSAFYGM